MIKKKWMAILLFMGLTAAMLAGCGEDKETRNNGKEQTNDNSDQSDDKVHLWDGYYFTTREDVVATGMKTFIRFNEDKTYYYIAFDGGFLDAGTWELVEEGTEYQKAGPDGDIMEETDNETAKSSQTIILTSMADGVEPLRIPYEDDELKDLNPGGLSRHNTFAHVADYSYDPAVDEEKAFTVKAYRIEGEDGATVTLTHDMRFEDYIGDRGIYGTWKKQDDTHYVLISEDGETATLTILEDGTADYTRGSDTKHLVSFVVSFFE